MFVFVCELVFILVCSMKVPARVADFVIYFCFRRCAYVEWQNTWRHCLRGDYQVVVSHAILSTSTILSRLHVPPYAILRFGYIVNVMITFVAAGSPVKVMLRQVHSVLSLVCPKSSGNSTHAPWTSHCCEHHRHSRVVLFNLNHKMARGDDTLLTADVLILLIVDEATHVCVLLRM